MAATTINSFLFLQCTMANKNSWCIDRRIGTSFLNPLYVSLARLPSFAAVDEALPPSNSGQLVDFPAL